MKVGIGLKETAYTPEAYAYASHMEKNGFLVQLESEPNLDPFNDVNIYFMGTRPFWKKKIGMAKEIHEYQSLSTAPYAYQKDFLKRYINAKPSGRIFLNQIVQRGLGFNDDIPFIYRDMGVDDALFQRPSENPLYDIVYSGSIGGRLGLIKTILQLADRGYRVLVIGHVADDERKILCGNKNITSVGRVERSMLPEMYRNCRYGLNYTPDIYPFNVQTSTKTLEYIASGLDVISNRYQWAENFSNKYDFSFAWLEDFDFSVSSRSISNENREFIRSFSWSVILDNSKIFSFIKNIVNLE